jgi:hypothetical protein
MPSMTPHSPDSLRELDSRTNDGIHVRLMWSQDENHVVVAVDDAKSGDSFIGRVQSNESAMDVFHHPYAYAAWHRIPTRPAIPALAVA